MGRSIPEIMKNGTRPRGKAKAGGEGEGDGDVGDKTSSWTLSKGLKGRKRKKETAHSSRSVAPHA